MPKAGIRNIRHTLALYHFLHRMYSLLAMCTLFFFFLKQISEKNIFLCVRPDCRWYRCAEKFFLGTVAHNRGGRSFAYSVGASNSLPLATLRGS
jgi:hypothetical protein